MSGFIYVATWSGFVYLAFITEAYARRIAGWRVSTHAKAPGRHKAWRFKRGRGRLIGRTVGGLHWKRHVLADAEGRPIQMFLSSGQTSDYIGARALLSSLPQAGTLLAH